MKTLKLITCIVLFCACSSFAQMTPNAVPATPAPKSAQSLNQDPNAPQTQQIQQTQQPLVAGQPGGQTPVARMTRYMVQIPHTKEQCQSVMTQMKEKGAPIMMRFDWSCNSGEHNGYALMGGQDDATVRKQLPEGVQKMAKIVKVEKVNTTAQADQMHK